VGFEKLGVLIFERSIHFYGVSIGISIAVSLLYAGIKRKSFDRFLIDTDTRLNLKDTISTAYEYLNLGKVSEFKNQLLEDASFKLSQLSRKQLFPLKYSFAHIFLTILILTNGILLTVDRFSFASKQNDMVSENSQGVGHFLQAPPAPKKAIVNKQKKTTKDPKDQTYQKLETLAKKIADPSMTRKELLTALTEMLEEVQSTQSLLSKNTRSSLGSETIKRLPYQHFQRYDDRSLQRLKNLFRAMFTDKIPEKIEKDAALFAEYQRFKNFLSQFIDSPEGNQSRQKDRSHTKTQANSKKSRNTNHPNKKKNDANDTGGNKAPVDNNQTSDRLANSAYPDQNQRGPSAFEDYWGENEDASLSPGRSKSSDQDKSPDETEKHKGPILQDKMISTETKDYSIHIRALTNIGKSTKRQEDITREYHHEMEGILNKEDIPLNYREYIKNYFISIGLRKDKK
jgi:hypothetical protein